ncbi:caspase family protein [bacterium]|nr:caspase family protein [bacterium]
MAKQNKVLALHILLQFLILSAYAQEPMWQNCSNFYEPQILFSNPAGISFREHRLTLFSSQFLFTGVSDNNFHNYYLGHIEPIRSNGALGIRTSHFTSHLFKQNTFTLLYGHSFIDRRLSVGININLHHQAYNRDEFRLQDPDDPLLAKGTSVTAFGAGFGILYIPLRDLHFGLSVDDVNRPDISIEGNRAFKPMIIRAGLSYQIFNFIPEINILHRRFKQRHETCLVFGLRQLWLDNSANIFLEYIDNCFSLGAAFSYKQFQFQYQFTYPLNELHEITSGTNQFTVCYNFGEHWGYPTAPEIDLISPQKSRLDTNYFHLQALVLDESGLKQTMIQLNDDVLTTQSYSTDTKSIIIDYPVFPLKEGENKIKIIAKNDNKQSSKEIEITVIPSAEFAAIASPPRVNILTQLEKATKTGSMQLEIETENILELKDLSIKLNGNHIQLRGIQPISIAGNRLDVAVEFDLVEGMNEIEVIGYNQRGSDSQKRSILFNPITESFYDNLWAVVIGIDAYQTDDVEDLRYAVNDARTIENLLINNFQFDHVMTLYNNQATKDNIIKAISKELGQAGENDGVFIFFAGHGCTYEGIRGEPLGFILPVNGTFNEDEYYLYNIPMSQIREISQTIQAKHIYYVMDCCYGGLLLRSENLNLAPSPDTDYRFLRSLSEKAVRQVLTAGGHDQPVLDMGPKSNSVFASVFIQGMGGEADANHDGYITAEELNFFVRQRVYANVKDIVRGDPIYQDIEQTPQYGKWYGEGEFIFSIPPE